jgi:uncharacterized protein (TIGR00730 family)
MKTVTYFSGARAGADPVYEEAARAVGQFVGRQRCIAKFGASRFGLMGAFCEEVKKAAMESGSGAKVVGVLPKKYASVNKPETLGIEYTLTDTLSERKQLLLDSADAFLVMPGGTGTLDEIYETIEEDYLPADRDPTIGEYTIRPIYVLNVKGYYDHTIAQLEHMVKEGFLVPKKMASLHVYDTLGEYLGALERFFKA